MTTALYRRYRPETFAEVIGQEHVTGPLMQALRSGRVNHAYLFSGPRGCGKTTSARILARTLNCHANSPETPIDTPCGVCPSCVELARGGSGSLDVVEIDAASHGGVDDARDLRERATFAPARDRYKIFIIDEAHMVSSAGFNALLKIVEEPPPHIKFVFATTEPDKVIGTIRSRTHHYPFRLVPPDVLGPYLESLCASEGVTLGGGVVPLVVRAGGGSVRDSLSVLDQLIAGASDTVVDYDLAVGLLGYTHSSLLDDVVDALAARDGASLFRVVDQLIASGHAPQRFVDDLLERLRDLIVIAVSGDAAGAVLRGQPADQLERMGAQASRLGVAELSRAADLVNAALTEMTGATSPRLHLELLCARLLLPGADEGTAGLAARVERLERGGVVAAAVRPGGGDAAAVTPASAGGGSGGLSGAAAARAALQASRRPGPVVEPSGGASPVSGPGGAAGGSASPAAVPVGVSAQSAAAATPPPGAPAGSAEPGPARVVEPVERATISAPLSEPAAARPEPTVVGSDVADAAASLPSATDGGEASTGSTASAGMTASAGSAAEGAAGGVTTEVVRRRWDEVLGSIASPGACAFLKENSQVLALEDGVLRLGFGSSLVAAARRGNTATISDAVYGTLGIAVAIDIVEADAAAGARPRDPAPTHPQEDPSDPDDPAQPAGPHNADGRRSSDVGDESGAADPRIVDERSDVSRNAVGNVTDRYGHAPGAPGGSGTSGGSGGAPVAVDDADAAWLAGASMYEPPADDEPEPPADYPEAERDAYARPTSLPGQGSTPVSTVTAPAPPSPARASSSGQPGLDQPGPNQPGPGQSGPGQSGPSTSGPNQAIPGHPGPGLSGPGTSTPGASRPGLSGSGGLPPGMPRRESPVEAVQRHALQARAHGASPSHAVPSAASPDPYDDAARDDPEISSTGLVGVPLVVTMLDGTVIDERLDQP